MGGGAEGRPVHAVLVPDDARLRELREAPVRRTVRGDRAVVRRGAAREADARHAPGVLLLMDFWPLGTTSPQGRGASSWRRLPLLALSLASSLVTIVAQRRGGAVGRFVEFPFGRRLANAATTTVAYVVKAVWPTRPLRPLPLPGTRARSCRRSSPSRSSPVSRSLAVRAARTRPAVTFGWLWYLVTLLPVIGLVQVGTQGMADRYTYIPLVGLVRGASRSGCRRRPDGCAPRSRRRRLCSRSRLPFERTRRRRSGATA